MLSFLDRVQKLRWIERCSNTQHIKPYSVAQHSFYISLYGLIFACLENERKEDVFYDLGLVVQKGIVHDLEECETGDILFPIHNDYPEFKEKLDFIRRKCIDNEVFKELPFVSRTRLQYLWQSAKDNSPEGKMIACMDKFEILMYAIGELDIGNMSMIPIYTTAIKIIKEQFPQIKSVMDVIDEIEIIYGKVVGENEIEITKVKES